MRGPDGSFFESLVFETEVLIANVMFKQAKHPRVFSSKGFEL